MGTENGNVVLDGTVAKLTDTAAGALNKAFNVDAIKAGTPLGVVHLVAKGEATTYNAATDKTTAISRLTGKSTSVTLDAGTAAALESLGVAVAPVGSASFDAATGTVSFPITGGFAAIHSDLGYKPGYIAGTVIHQASGLKFSKGTKSIEVTDFVVDPGNSILTATAGGKSGIPLLDLDGTAVKVGSRGRRRHPRRHRRQAHPDRRRRPQRHLRGVGLHRPACPSVWSTWSPRPPPPASPTRFEAGTSGPPPDVPASSRPRGGVERFLSRSAATARRHPSEPGADAERPPANRRPFR